MFNLNINSVLVYMMYNDNKANLNKLHVNICSKIDSIVPVTYGEVHGR